MKQHVRLLRVTAPLCILLLAVAVFAGKVRCPVCGQEFADTVVECPNDGTNLTVEGRKVETPTRNRPPADSDEDPAAGNAESETDALRYRRQDVEGTRRRTTSVEDEDDAASAERLDRKRRLGTERRVVDNRSEEQRLREERERRARQVFAAQDDQLRMQYARDREADERARRLKVQEAEVARRGEAELRWRSLWTRGAPLTSVGARLWWMGEGEDPGPVSGAELDVNFLRDKARLGVSSFLGFRSLSDRNDLVLFESIQAGVQYPWRFSPWIAGRLGIGATVEHRFGESNGHLLRGIGAEAGIDCRVRPFMVLTPSVGFMHYAISNVWWNTATLKLAIGF